MTFIKIAGKSIFCSIRLKKGSIIALAKINIAPFMKNIAIQCLLRPALTVVERCTDYENFRATIERIDRLLIDSEVESQAIELALERGKPISV